MDLRRLEYFLAVVEHGRVTNAAAALHVAQPSLSQAIRALESDLGVELFHREGRGGLRPTSAGQALIEPARRALRDLAAARAAVDNVVELAAGWLDLAACPLLTLDPVVPALITFHRRHDGVPVRLHEPRDGDDLVRLIEEGRCELALSYLPLPSGVLTATAIGTHEIWVVLPPDSRLPAGPVPLTALAGMSVVDTMDGQIRAAVNTALRQAGVTLSTPVRTRHWDAVTPLVLAGAGIAFTTAAAAAEAARSGAEVRPLVPGLRCPFGLIHRDTLSPAARAFVGVLLTDQHSAPEMQH
jgi:DNA-binding transcriptional LysR family regulator